MLFTFDQRFGRDLGTVKLAVLLFGGSLVVSLFGLFWAANMENFARIYHGSPGRGCFAVASLFFLAGVLSLIIVPVLL